MTADSAFMGVAHSAGGARWQEVPKHVTETDLDRFAAGLVQQFTDHTVVGHHGIVIEPLTGQPHLIIGRVGPEMHSGGVNQAKKGVSSATARLMKSLAEARNSRSMVSIRFLVRGPLSSIRPSAKERITPRGPNRATKAGSLG